MKRLLQMLGVCVLLAGCTTTDTQWNFVGERIPRTGTEGAEATITREGLVVRTEAQQGIVFWEGMPLNGPADVLVLQARTATPLRVGLLWQPISGDDDSLAQLDIVIPASESFTDVPISLAEYPEWHWQTPIIGLLLPPQSQLLLRRIDSEHWSATEKLVEAWRSFWTFDSFGLYSINFLWGPRLATNPVSRAALYDTQPPVAPSANAVFYWILAAAAIAALWLKYKGKGKPVAILVWTVASLWLLYDVRMGLEILSYAQDDVSRYVLAESGQRSLRTHGALFQDMDAFAPVLAEENRYGVIAQSGLPAFALLRYATYPAVPVMTDQADDTLRAWVVWERPDIVVNTSGALMHTNGTVIAPHGHIAVDVRQGTFLFIADPS